MRLVEIGTLLLVVAAVAGGMGVGEMRAPSDYTGYVVDVEDDRGFVFRTTQIHMKTHPRSSAVETFCIREGDDEMLEQARESLREQKRVDVEYHRPLYVARTQCNAGTSLLDNITWSGNTTTGQ